MINLIKDNWDNIINRVYDITECSNLSYETWLKPLSPMSIEKKDNDDTYILNIFANVKYTDKHFYSVMEKKFKLALTCVLEEFTCEKFNFIYHLKDNENKTISTSHNIVQTPKGIKNCPNIEHLQTFSSFVQGKNNAMAYATALAVSKSPGDNSSNPLCIYGGVGLGKTHLMKAIANEVAINNPNYKIAYVTSETFTNELIETIQFKNKTPTEFRNKYRNIDLLLIDDIQFLQGKEATQEEFFHTFNTLLEAGKQIVISSEKIPTKYTNLPDRLISRFKAGVIVDIQSPDYETRVAILNKKEELFGVNIDHEVIAYIAENVTDNIRELEGSLKKIILQNNMDPKTTINLEMAKDVLKDIITPNKPLVITMDYIVTIVSDHFECEISDILGNSRKNFIIKPRHIAIYLARELTTETQEKIGEYFGGRDHSTIVNAIKKIEKAINTDDKDVIVDLNVIKKKISPQ